MDRRIVMMGELPKVILGIKRSWEHKLQSKLLYVMANLRSVFYLVKFYREYN